MLVKGDGIPDNTTVTAINSLQITLSNAVSKSMDSVSLNFAWAAWDNSSWNQTNLYKLSFDSTKPGECTTWYTVASLDTDYQLTLAEDAVTKSASA